MLVRTHLKEELGCSSAEMVYGTPLRVPRDFLPGMADTHDDTSLCLRQLRDQVCSLIAITTSCHSTVPTSVPQNLQQAKFFFIHHDAHRKPLQRPYKCPFKVIQPGLKTFQVDVGRRSETISVDRLKPAEIDLERHPAQVAVPRRRGRPCKLPPQHISALGGGGV